MRKHLLTATLLGAAVVLGCAGAARADLIITGGSTTPPNTWLAETGQSIPTGTPGFVGGSLVATHDGSYTFTYGPLGLVSPPGTGHGNSTNINDFEVIDNLGGTHFFCTQVSALNHCGGVATIVGSSFTIPLNAGDINFAFLYDLGGATGTGPHTLANDQRDDANGAYLAQIGLGGTPSAGPGLVAYLGLSDNPYPADADFQDLTLSVAVPEPGGIALLGSGLVSLAFAYRRKTRKAGRKN